MTRRLPLTLVLTLAALLLAPAALAAPGTAAVGVPDTPHARFGVWVDSLQEFLGRHPELTPEQAGAVIDAQRLAEPRLFVDRPSAADAKVLADGLDALRRTLSCATFGDLTAGFGPLRSWLESNEALAAAAATCNCGGNDDCASGYTCHSVTCTSPAGTTHWGICRKGTVAVEPSDPAEPIAH